MARASASLSVYLGFISQVKSHQKTLKNGIHSCSTDSVENKPAILLVVSLGKTLNGMPSSLCGRQTDGGVKQPARRDGPSLTEDLQTERKR